MELAGIGQTAESTQVVHIYQQLKSLLELQGDLVVQLLASAKVPGPADKSISYGLGTRIDIHA